jgi:hypothetical protein
VKKKALKKALNKKRAKPRAKRLKELEADITQVMVVVGNAHQELLRENAMLRFRLARIEAMLNFSFIEPKPEPECTCGECVEEASTLN